MCLEKWHFPPGGARSIERHPVRQLRRAAERAGTLAPVSWHELHVRLGGRERSPGSHAGGGESLALHWVRGHFADYREHGLFGKHHGVYWWSPHLAGRADRVVHKDYKLEEQA